MRVYGKGAVIPQQQADAAISQNNPVSDTLYQVLATTRNVKIECLMASITWAVTQPTNLRIIVTVDGIAKTFTIANPVTGSAYVPNTLEYGDPTNNLLTDVNTSHSRFAVALQSCSGRSVSVQCAITWAVTQPTPLNCRVKYAKW